LCTSFSFNLGVWFYTVTVVGVFIAFFVRRFTIITSAIWVGDGIFFFTNNGLAQSSSINVKWKQAFRAL
jgi:hypothetical protein